MKIMRLILLLSCFLTLCLCSLRLNKADQWRARSIYQVLTDRIITDGRPSLCGEDLTKYCGGTFKDITNSLDYIKGTLGYDAIYISPFVENTENGYHGYWAKNIYKVNPHFGTEQDLKNLVREAHFRDIFVMIDVVFNHIGYVKNDDFSDIVPFNEAKHYHQPCDITDDDYKNDNRERIETCRLFGLPDINTESEHVKELFFNWIGDHVIAKFGFDGLRVDTVRHVNMRFWEELNAYLNDAPIILLGEVFDGNMKHVAEYQTRGGFDGMLNFPQYYALQNAFIKRQPMSQLSINHLNQLKSFKDITLLGSFIDNHDVERIASQLGRVLTIQEVTASLISMITFSHLAPGMPMLLYGTESQLKGQTSDIQRHRLVYDPINAQKDATTVKYISKLNSLRKERHTYDRKFEFQEVEANLITFTLGDDILAIVVNNQYEVVHQVIEIRKHPFKQGDKICNIFIDHDCITLDRSPLVVTLIQGYPKVYAKVIPENKARKLMLKFGPYIIMFLFLTILFYVFYRFNLYKHNNRKLHLH